MLKTFFKNRKLKKDWRLVHTHETDFSWSNTDLRTGEKTTSKDVTNVYIDLYENGVGDRKVEARYSGDNTDHKQCKLTNAEFYNKTAFPWTKGVYFPGIDSYETVEHKAMLDKLAYTPKDQ